MQPSPADRAQQIEPILSAAGFRMLPADSNDKMNHLTALPQLQVRYFGGKDGAMQYWMADANFCQCLYVGDEKAYQRYQNFRLQQRLAEQQQMASEEQMMAAQEEQAEMMNPFLFGPVWVY